MSALSQNSMNERSTLAADFVLPPAIAEMLVQEFQKRRSMSAIFLRLHLLALLQTKKIDQFVQAAGESVMSYHNYQFSRVVCAIIDNQGLTRVKGLVDSTLKLLDPSAKTTLANMLISIGDGALLFIRFSQMVARQSQALQNLTQQQSLMRSPNETTQTSPGEASSPLNSLQRSLIQYGKLGINLLQQLTQKTIQYLKNALAINQQSTSVLKEVQTLSSALKESLSALNPKHGRTTAGSVEGLDALARGGPSVTGANAAHHRPAASSNASDMITITQVAQEVQIFIEKLDEICASLVSS